MHKEFFDILNQYKCTCRDFGIWIAEFKHHTVCIDYILESTVSCMAFGMPTSFWYANKPLKRAQVLFVSISPAKFSPQKSNVSTIQFS
jgi:hypothetical protein